MDELVPTGLGALANLRWLEVTVLTRRKGVQILAQPSCVSRASPGRIRRFGNRLRTTWKMITRRTVAGILATEHPDIPHPGFSRNHLHCSLCDAAQGVRS